MSGHYRDAEGREQLVLPGRAGIRDRLWSAKYDRLERRIRRRVERVQRERERLRHELHAVNYHLIQGMQPTNRRDDWEARQTVMMNFLDPTLDHVERMTGWRFGYEAERRNEHHWPEHRFPEKKRR